MSRKFAKSGKTLTLSLIAGLSLTSLLACHASSKDDFTEEANSTGKGMGGVVTSDQLLQLGTPTADSLRMTGEQYMRMGNTDKAIALLQKSVEMSPSDMDGRILYATALEKKFTAEKDRDPQLFNFLVKQWLFIQKKADFMNQNSVGQAHLLALTGTAPRKYESKGRFLSRVILPEDDDTRAELNKRKFTAVKLESTAL